MKKIELQVQTKGDGKGFETKLNKASSMLEIEGFASHIAKDRMDDVVLPTAFESTISSFLQNPVMLLNHDMETVIGKFTELSVRDDGLYVRGMISKTRPDVQELVKEGILTSLSIGFNTVDQEFNRELDANVIKDLELLEISVVSIPANPRAIFNLSKSAKNLYYKFHPEYKMLDYMGKDFVEKVSPKGQEEDFINNIDETKLSDTCGRIIAAYFQLVETKQLSYNISKIKAFVQVAVQDCNLVEEELKANIIKYLDGEDSVKENVKQKVKEFFINEMKSEEETQMSEEQNKQTENTKSSETADLTVLVNAINSLSEKVDGIKLLSEKVDTILKHFEVEEEKAAEEVEEEKSAEENVKEVEVEEEKEVQAEEEKASENKDDKKEEPEVEDEDQKSEEEKEDDEKAEKEKQLENEIKELELAEEVEALEKLVEKE